MLNNDFLNGFADRAGPGLFLGLTLVFLFYFFLSGFGI